MRCVWLLGVSGKNLPVSRQGGKKKCNNNKKMVEKKVFIYDFSSNFFARVL